MIISEKQLQEERTKLVEDGQEQSNSEAIDSIVSVIMRYFSGRRFHLPCKQDAPPRYSDHIQDTRFRGSYSTETEPPSKPSNFLSLILKDKPIRGGYVIDPLMHIPSNLLPPLNAGETEQDRKNIYLRTKDGSIDVDIWLIGQEDSDAPKNGTRTTLSLSSNDGSITAKIVSTESLRRVLSARSNAV
jgi:hypothetical protein